MPAPRKPYPIAGKVTTATVTDSVYVCVRNLTNGEQKIVQTKSDGSYVVDLADADFDTDYANGDIIEYSLLGDAYGGGTHTVATGVRARTKFNIVGTDRSSTNTVGVSI